MKTKSQTRGVEGKITWDESFDVTVPTKSDSPLKIAIYREHEYSNDEKIAVAKGFDLVEISHAKEFSAELQEPSSEKKHPGQLVIRVEVQLPKIDLSGGGQLLMQFVKIPSVSPSWQRFLTSFQHATELASQFAELDPTAKVAVGVISFAFTAVVKELERDQRVCDLQEMMTSLLVFFHDIEPLKKSTFLRNVLDRLLCQVSECTFFILQYPGIESFVQRTAINLTSDTDALLDQFSTVFSTLKAELALGTSLQAAINTEYILNQVNDIDILMHINCLNHLQDSGWCAEKQCGPNTRDFLLSRIQRWIASSDQGLFVLTGPPGSGKSTVLHTIAGHLDKQNLKRLGAGIFLNEETKGEKTAKSIMRTIVYYLARSNPCLGRKIAEEIARHPSLESADATRYGDLVIEVSNGLALFGPVVIVVDDLHEIKTSHEQDLIQRILCRVAMEAHSQLRLIVSSRTWVASSGQISVLWDIDQLDSPSSEDHTFIQAAFENLSRQNLLGGYSLQELTPLIQRHSLGDSQWISAAGEFLTAEPKLGRHFLDELLSSSPYPATLEVASTGVSITVLRLLLAHKAVLASDLLYTGSGSKLFIELGSKQSSDSTDSSTSVESSLSPALLLDLGYLAKAESTSVHGFIEHNLQVPPCLRGILRPDVNPPLLPKTDFPLNIYQFYLREASAAENGGPIYARFALPASKPLLDGEKIKDELGNYGMLSNDVKNMLARSPPGGCEWIILHHGLFPSERKEGRNSVAVTTPVLTQAILEQLACIWVYWSRVAREDTCQRLRDGRGESNFLQNFSFSDVTYHGTHAELVCDGQRKGNLMAGDRIQVNSTEDNGKMWAVLALALRY